jgi:hypothetical protein
MSAGSVIGRDLSDAQRILQQAGVSAVGVARTAPPGRAPAGPLRVVRQRTTAEGVQLVAAASVPLSGEGDRHD